jgi:sulfate adenylyltransferase subunit 2
MDHLDKLESESIFIIREAYHHVPNLAMLWSVGKDSTVLVKLCQKAFFGHIPIPLVHIDTGFKIPEMIAYRDRLALKWKLQMVYGQNEEALKEKKTFPDGNISCIECCKSLKTAALQKTVTGEGKRYIMNLETGKYEVEANSEPYGGLIVGIRSDEEGSRSKERVFSPRGISNDWEIADQPPEFWGQFNTDFPPKSHVRVHPLLDWTEADIWRYIEREDIPIVDLYFDRGEGTRYRSLGCGPCTKPIQSSASNLLEVIAELEKGKLKNIAERSGRAQDKEGRGGLEELRRGGYM